MGVVLADTIVMSMLAGVLVLIIDLLMASCVCHTLIVNLVSREIASLISWGMCRLRILLPILLHVLNSLHWVLVPAILRVIIV